LTLFYEKGKMLMCTTTTPVSLIFLKYIFRDESALHRFFVRGGADVVTGSTWS
jgi:hypothetical protein